MASSASPAPSAAPSVLATSKTPTERRRARADECLAAIEDILEKVNEESTAKEFVDALTAVWVRVFVASAATPLGFD